jgi:hypothetical protein
MGTVSAIRQERFEKRYYGRWLAAKEMSALLGGESGVFCEARCGLNGVGGERERDPWYCFGYGRNGRSFAFPVF